jgi:hypothetical protein
MPTLLSLASSVMPIVIALLGTSVACAEDTPRPTASDSPAFSKLLGLSRDLNAPVVIDATLDRPGKKKVLIYYANETAPSADEAKNYDVLIQWLKTSDEESIRKIARSLESDLKTFHAVVDEEIAAIQRNLSKADPNTKVAAVIFTNRLARRGVFRVQESGSDAVAEAKIAMPKLNGLVCKSNPLAHPDVFTAALTAVSKRFDAANHQYVLVTKSHGGPQVALTPRIVLEASTTSRQDLLAMLDRDVTRTKSETLAAGTRTLLESAKLLLDADKWEMPFLDKDNALDASDINSKLPAVGVTKADFVSTITAMGRQSGMKFPVLFVESCRSQLEDVELRELTAADSNIGLLYTSDLKGLSYKTLDYDKVFQSLDDGHSLSQAMHRELLAVHQKHKADRERGADPLRGPAAELNK